MSQVGTSRSGAAVGVAGPPTRSRLDALRRAWPAYAVLACTLLLTLGAWRYAERTVRASELERFDRVVARSRAAIDQRLESYLQILTGVRALFASSAAVEHAEFRSFVVGLELDARYPSIRGMSWIPRVPAASQGGDEALMRRGGAPARSDPPGGGPAGVPSRGVSRAGRGLRAALVRPGRGHAPGEPGGHRAGPGYRLSRR